MEKLDRIPSKVLIGIIGILVVLLLCSVKSCNDNKNKVHGAMNELSSKETYYKNKLGTITASKQVLELSNKDLKKHILKQNDTLKKLAKEFSKIEFITTYDNNIKVDTFTVTFRDTIPCDFRIFDRYETKNMSFNYQISPNDIQFEDFTIPNKTTLITGFKRKWFLGKQTLTTDITNSNPYILASNVKSYEVKIPKRFYDTRLFNIGIGVIFGYVVAK